MVDLSIKYNQNATANKLGGLIAVPEGMPDGLKDWAAWFCKHVVDDQGEFAARAGEGHKHMLKAEKTERAGAVDAEALGYLPGVHAVRAQGRRLARVERPDH